MLTFLGVVVVVVGFIARIHPLLVVAAAALVTSLSAGMSLVEGISALGKAFNDNRYVSLVWLVLPVIGLLERSGLQERARALISRVKTATAGRILLAYFVVRQLSAALGLTSLGGHAQMVRPLIAPMAEGAAENRHGPLPDRTRWRIRASAAAADNVALFFGEDIFLAVASILIIKAFLEQNGILLEPLQLSIWAIPTAVLALLIHGTRLLLLDRRIHRELARAGAGKAAE
ncbi:DUF969 domain-containing protein [Sorangium sp. So ce375]|uniref:DUF969 domain-containing protein n=1 Tax=Sorangium sp. So ce375 TaxID=3133306 RepID=UPI003F5BE323